LSSIINLVTNLEQHQKDALHRILTKLTAGDRLSTSDVGLLGFSIETCLGVFIMEVMDITKPTIARWLEDGCPRNADGTYNLKMVIDWRIKREKERWLKQGDPKRDAEIEKIKNQNEKLLLEIQEMRRQNISRERFEDIQRRQASELMAFLSEGYKRIAQELMAALGMKLDTIDKFNAVMDEFVKKATDAFIQSGEDLAD
jgi:phage terminase Nu1 subunit (DNA packaging protein)